MSRATTGFDTELNGGTELANATLDEFVVGKPMLAEETGGSMARAVGSGNAARGGALAATDLTTAAVPLLAGGATKTAARPLSAAFLSCVFISPNAAFCEPATS